MKTKEELKAIFDQAKEFGCEWVEVDGIKYQFKTPSASQPPSPFIQDLKPEEIMKPLSVLDDYSEEEILYWATPYFDELQARKQSQNEKLRAENDLRSN